MIIDEQVKTERFKFSGVGGEYFEILFSNQLLTLITLGIYSPWAKVRQLQYLYGNTELAAGAFQFTANPKKMLVSRLIAMAVFVTYFLVEHIDSTAANVCLAIMLLAFFSFAPIITLFVMTFRLRHSRWRGVSFNFRKDYKGAYKVYLIPIFFVGLISASIALNIYVEEVENFFGIAQQEQATQELQDGYYNPYFAGLTGFLVLLYVLLVPFFDFINVRFLTRNIKFGTAGFSYSGTLKEFYQFYVGCILIVLGALVLYSFIPMFGILALFLAVPLVVAYFKSKRFNLIYGRINIDNEKFKVNANVPVFKMMGVIITNALMVTFTLGLMFAWAQIRTMRLLLNSTSVQSEYSFDQFVTEQNEEMTAIGEEVADIFDVDLAI